MTKLMLFAERTEDVATFVATVEVTMDVLAVLADVAVVAAGAAAAEAASTAPTRAKLNGMMIN